MLQYKVMPLFWFLPALVSNFLLALVQIADRFLLIKKSSQSAAAYAFFVAVSSLSTLIAAPPCLIFGCLTLPDAVGLVKDVLAGAALFFGLIPLYLAIQKGGASRVVPAVGGLTSGLVLILAAVFLHERFLPIHYLAVLFIVLGYLAISKSDAGVSEAAALLVNRNVVLASTLFSLGTVLMKDIFQNQPFISGWLLVNYAIGGWALTTLFSRPLREEIASAPKASAAVNKIIFVTVRLAGAVAVLLFNYALFLGPATLVQASQGAQYVFLLLISSGLSRYHPEIIKEEFGPKVFFAKAVATGLFVVGLTLIAVTA